VTAETEISPENGKMRLLSGDFFGFFIIFFKKYKLFLKKPLTFPLGDSL